MSLRWYVVSEQFNYTKNRVFHAILLPIIIEFSRCIGTYSSAKFENFIFCSGYLSEENIVHEFMHHIVHPIIENRKDEILCCNLADLDIDTSYYLNNDEAGILNAFEEYMVRTLTDKIVGSNVPETLDMFFDQEIHKLMRTPYA